MALNAEYTFPIDNSAGLRNPPWGSVLVSGPRWSGNTWSADFTFGWNNPGSPYGYSIVQLSSHGIYSIWVHHENGASYGPFSCARGTYPVVTPGATWTNPAVYTYGRFYQTNQRTNPHGAFFDGTGLGVVTISGIPAGKCTITLQCLCDTPYIDAAGGKATFSYGKDFYGGDIDPGPIVPPEPDNQVVTLNAVGEHDVTISHNLLRAGSDYRSGEYSVGIWDPVASVWINNNIGTNSSNAVYSGLRHDYAHTWQFRCFNTVSFAELVHLRRTVTFTTLIDTAEVWFFNGTTFVQGYLFRHNGTAFEKSKVTHVFTESGFRPNRNNLDKQ